MTISQLLPSLRELNREEKLQAFQFLETELASVGAGRESAATPPSAAPDLDADVETAVAFYRANLQDLLEPVHNGANVAIHLPSGSYEVDRWAGQARRSLRAKHPEGGVIVVHKIGPGDSGLVARIRGERPK